MVTEIADWNDLDNIRNNLSEDYELLNDLDQNTPGYGSVASSSANGGAGFDPIGEYNSEFVGSFDGQENEIKSLFIDRTNEDNVALFAESNSNAEISNTGLKNVDISGDFYAAGLVADHRSGTISNSYVTGSVSGSSYVGGLVGYSYDEITDSYCTADVDGGGEVGGLVADSTGSITRSYATGSVFGGSSVGGLVGYQGGYYGGTITESYATGSVYGGTDYAGGLVGYSDGYYIGDITDSYAAGDVSADGGYVGGLVGYMYDGSITTSYAVGAVSIDGGGDAGGLVADGDNASITDSYWDTETSGQPSSYGGTGLTTDEMTGDDAPNNMVGFDFQSNWNTTSSYPELVWQEEQSFYTFNGTKWVEL